jgi:hypothetical protein
MVNIFSEKVPFLDNLSKYFRKKTGGNRILRKKIAIFVHDKHNPVIYIAYYITDNVVMSLYFMHIHLVSICSF